MRPEDHAFQRRWLILGVLCFSLLVIVLDNSILNVALPTLQKDLHATESQLQWIVDSYTLVFAGLLLTMGSLGDRFGRRRALDAGFALFGIGSLASAFAGTPGQLIATRGFMGIGCALIMPATLSIITNLFPPDERAKAIGAWAGVAGVGIALGPLTGGFLLEHFYWGSVFLVNLPIVAFGLVAGIILIPESKDPSAPKLDPIGAGLSIVGLTALLYGIIEAPSYGWGDPVIVGSFVMAALVLAAFVLWERHSTHPMLDISFFRNPRFTAASSAIMLVFFALFGSMFLITQYFQLVIGYTPLETGVRMLPYAAVMMVIAPLSPHVVARVGTKITVAIGLFTVAAGLALMMQLDAASSYVSILWRMMFLSFGMGLTMAPATDSIMGSLPLAKAGVGSAVNDTTRMVGGALGVAVIGSALSSVYGSKMSEVFAAARHAGQAVPQSASDAAQNSLYGALEVAKQAPGSLGTILEHTAKAAFVSGMHRGVVFATVTAVLGAVVALVWLPARASESEAVEPRDDVVPEFGTAYGLATEPVYVDDRPHATDAAFTEDALP
ncbi:MAG: MFS transporter [Acidimicrobiia bacterium]